MGCSSLHNMKFVNRVKEINALKNWCSHFRYTPLYIYGPEGCGKTRLLREFVKMFNSFFNDGIAIYVDALEDKDIRKALLTSTNIMKTLNILKAGLEVIKDLVSAKVPIGEALAGSTSLLLDVIADKLYGKNLKDKHILIIVDDVVNAIGLGKIEWYIKYLYELMQKLNEEYRPEAINFIVTTSEGRSLDLVTRHTYVGVRLLWNLDRNAFEELFYELNPPSNIRFEDIWLMFGGNPRKLIDLAEKYSWNINVMLNDYIELSKRIISETVREGLLDMLKLTIDNVDTLYSLPFTEPGKGGEISKLEEILINNNTIIWKSWTMLHSEGISKDPTIGIGEYYAWQSPLYKNVLANLLEKLTPK